MGDVDVPPCDEEEKKEQCEEPKENEDDEQNNDKNVSGRCACDRLLQFCVYASADRTGISRIKLKGELRF